jgi:neurofibromin 1
MKHEAQLAIVVPLRHAVWNWIDIFPDEFNDVVRGKGRMEGSAERVFDMLYKICQPGFEKEFWPTLMVLNCIAPERLSAEFTLEQVHQKHSSRKVRHSFIKASHQALPSSRICVLERTF